MPENILIVAAMQEEQSYLIESMGKHSKISREHLPCNLSLVWGKVGKTQVSIVLSGIGKVQAALATSLAVEKMLPDAIINVGVAGGLQAFHSPCDFVIAEEVRYHDVDATPFGYKRGQVPGLPEFFLPDKNLSQRIYDISCQEKISSHKGVILSGDRFVSSISDQQDLRKFSPGAHAVDMESGGIAQIAFLYNIPFVIARSLSDKGDDSALGSYRQFLDKAAQNTGKVLMRFLEEPL